MTVVRPAAAAHARCAVLFVRKTSHYKTMAGVDAYDIERDALTWPGGQPAVFHPPCRAWGQLKHFARPRPGERDLAIWSMAMCRKWGGVVEHPKNSDLWRAAGCIGYGMRDQFGGALFPVFQSWWGHKAPKATCFYVVGAVPQLPEFEPPRTLQSVASMSQACREVTPPELAVWLVNLAASCRAQT